MCLLLQAKRLFQQYLVDTYCKIETERLQFLRHEQTALRADCNLDLRDAILNGMGTLHGLCGCINPNSPCMQDSRCSKKYPKQYMAETQLGADSYPLYRRSSPGNGGQVSTISMRIGSFRVNQQVDNRWIVPSNKLLLRSMNCHCNMEPCMSNKSIKYVLNYAHKGCDQAMFTLQSSLVNEISDYPLCQ